MKVGDKIELLESIWDDGADNHHPPCWLAFAGEILVVRAIREVSISVSHEEITDRSFAIYADEYRELSQPDK